MNRLTVGTDRSDFYTDLPEPLLLIADSLPPIDFHKATLLDLSKHNLNPVQDIDYLKATDHLAVLDAVFPEGKDTLTKRYANFQILEALLQKPKRLDRLIEDSKETHDAYQKIQRLFLSPTLSRFLKPAATNFRLDRTVIAVLDRSILGDFDAFVIGNFLISAYPGQIVIPDYGFYGCQFHTTLIQQERLILGVNYLDQLPKELKDDVLLILNKAVRRCTSKDA